MIEKRSIALAHSQVGCPLCLGAGRTIGFKEELLCRCVLRGIFRACLRKYELGTNDRIVAGSERMPVLSSGVEARRFHLSKPYSASVEYAADFWLLAKRVLNQYDWIVFREHIIDGKPWQRVAPKVKLERGNFFHAVYRIQEVVGLAAIEMQPYALYPFSRYFTGNREPKRAQSTQLPAKPKTEAKPMPALKVMAACYA